MTRRWRLLALSVLMGPVLTVCTAWAALALVPVERWMRYLDVVGPQANVRVPAAWPFPVEGSGRPVVGSRTIVGTGVSIRELASFRQRMATVEAGWPWRALDSSVVSETRTFASPLSGERGPGLHAGVHLSNIRFVPVIDPRDPQFGTIWPVRPIAAGFVVNSVFYGGLTWLGLMSAVAVYVSVRRGDVRLKELSAHLPRMLRRGAIFLLIGCAITVGVSWGAMLVPFGAYVVMDAPPPRRSPSFVPRSQGYPSGATLRHVGPALSSRQIEFGGRRGAPREGDVFIRSAGWPARALRSAIVVDSTTSPVRAPGLHGGIPAPASMCVRHPRILMPNRGLPVVPVWPGFVIDVVLYGGLFWVIAAVPANVRRRGRRLRGECLRCGYDLSGLDACPECGQAGTS